LEDWHGKPEGLGQKNRTGGDEVPKRRRGVKFCKARKGRAKTNVKAGLRGGLDLEIILRIRVKCEAPVYRIKLKKLQGKPRKRTWRTKENKRSRRTELLTGEIVSFKGMGSKCPK